MARYGNQKAQEIKRLIAGASLEMRAMWPNFQAEPLRRGRLTWRGEVQPTPGSAVYTVKVIYSPPSPPKVFLEKPKLVRHAEHQSFNHVYPDGRLCLYDPRNGEWAPEMGIAKTIVPWTVQWLFYYEIWLITGEWCGDEAPHSGEKDEDLESSN